MKLCHYLACFASFATKAPTQELAVMKEKVDCLEYILEQEKSTNTKLVKEVDFHEEAIWKAQEKIDR